MSKVKRALQIVSEDEENVPTDKDLWQDVIAVTKGEKDSVSANGKTVEAPNDGDGFDVYPSAYANGWAAKMYKKLGGEWKTKDENVTRMAVKLGMLNEDLDQWFDEEWVDISETDEDGNHPPCGETSDTGEREMDPEKNYPKCVPKSKAKDMTEKEKEELVKSKQASVNADDEDQDSSDGGSDSPTYTSSDPDEHFHYKKSKTKMTESKLRKLIREEAESVLKEENISADTETYREVVSQLRIGLPFIGPYKHEENPGGSDRIVFYGDDGSGGRQRYYLIINRYMQEFEVIIRKGGTRGEVIGAEPVSNLDMVSDAFIQILIP